MDDDLKFAADHMLGRLAKWLRVIGYDTVYTYRLDQEFLKKTIAENRIFLTRNTRLIKRRPFSRGKIRYIFIVSDFLNEQVKQVLDTLSLPALPKQPFCIICNIKLEDTEKKDVKTRVPEYVYKTQDKFTVCNKCKRIYWEGTHWKHIENTLESL